MGQVKQVQNYDVLSRLNHWLVAALFLVVFVVGFAAFEFMPDGETRGAMIGLHKGLGVVVLILGAWRVFYRLKQGFLAEASTMPRWQEVSAKLVHWLLLAGIILFPISGMIGSYFGGREVAVMGLFTIPAGPKVEWLSTIGYGVHVPLAYLTLAALLLHVGGALKHHIIDKDATLTRMLGRG